MVSRHFFFVFAYVSELGMQEAVTTRLRERQRASVGGGETGGGAVKVERVKR